LRALVCRALVAAVVASGLVVVPSAVASAASDPPPQAQGPATPAERTALDEARETGRQVVVPEHTTETREVLANPEGTFTLRTSAAPQRVKRDGGWTPVDTSLRANPDGTLSPAAALVDVAFSGGGTGPVISLWEGGGRVSLSWPTPLPAPVVDGPKATYPEVLPGVDLVAAASAVGYSHVLVVRDARAAANPALLDIVLTAETQGLTLDVDDGVLNARDANGARVFAGSTPVMWDGSRSNEKEPAPTATDPGGAKVTEIGLTARKAARSDAKELRVQPDRAALTGPGVTYPVYIDPGMAGGQQAWAEVTANGYKYWNAAMDAQVGRCYNREGYCGSLTLARSYFRLDTSPLQQRNGYTAVVFSAEMWFTQVWGAHLCVAEPVSLYSSGYFDSGITWSNQPLGAGTLSNALDTRSSGAGTQCTGPGGVKFDAAGVKNYAQTSANNNWGSVHMALAAPDEGNDYQWKKFATSGTAAPHFDVVFSFPPGPASVHGVSNAVACTGLAITPDARPTLYGTASDNNSPPLNVGLTFEVWDSNGIARKASGATSGASGVRQGWAPANALPDGDYAYRIAVHNVFPGDSSKNLSNGTWSPWHWFRVKATAPATAPRIVSSVDYPANYWGAPKGELGAIAVDSGGATGVAGYTYTFSGAGTEPVPNTSTCDYTPGGSLSNGNFAPASVSGPTWLPITNGLSTGYHTLHVRGFDHAHNLSPESTAHVFYVAPNTGQAVTRYEAENLPRSQPTGQGKPFGPQDQCCNLTWSGGKQLVLSADAPGQSFTVAFEVATEADYQVSIGMTKANDYGRAAFSLDGQAIGRPDPASTVGSIDGYNPDAINALTNLGIRRLTAGTHRLKVTLTSTHPNSVGVRYKAGIDHITIAHTTRYEAELPAQVIPSQPADQGVPLTVEQQSTGNGPFSEGAHLLFAATAQNKSFDLAFTVPNEADYALGIALSKRANRGKLRIAVDGVPLRRTDTEPWDGYQGTGGQAAYLPLGGAHLKAGQHRLTITVVGKNDSSSGYTAGVDYLNAVAINGVTAASFTDAMNNRGFGTDGTTAASLDFNGQSLSSTALATAGLQPGKKVTHGRATFTIPTANPATGNDNVVAMGQTIPLPAEHRVKATAIGLLALSTCGDTQPTTATVTYTDGTTSNPVVPGVPDWIGGPQPAAAATLSHWLGGTTPDTTKRPKTYAVFAPVDPTKTLASITLPNTGTAFMSNTCGPAPALHVLSIAPAPVAAGWLGAWAAPIDKRQNKSSPDGQTFRMVVRPTEQGQTMRIRLSNTGATVPATILRTTVAAQSGIAAAALTTPTAVLFNGSASVTIPAGGDVFSDPVAFPSTAGGSGNLVVSVALPPSAPQAATNVTGNNMAFDAPGDVTGNVDGVPYGDQWASIYGNTYYLSGIEISSTDLSHGTVAVLSDYWFSYGDRYPEWWPVWTDFLSSALGDRLPGSITHVGYPEADEAAQSRERFVLAEPSVRTVIVNMNQVSTGDTLASVRQRLEKLMAANSPLGLRKFSRTDGTPLSVVLTTIPPKGLSATDPREVLRKQVNDLIRTSYIDLGADQFVDFDAAVRDPAAPEKAQAGLLDGTQPNEAFEQRLAQAVVEAVDGFPPLTL
jgi:hypothetical protein